MAQSQDNIPSLDQFTQELRIASNNSTGLGYQAGVFYFDENLDIETFDFPAPDAPDPLKADPWLTYLWNIYLHWLKTAETFDPRSKDWPQPDVREALLTEIDPYSATGYLAGQGHQILERILYVLMVSLFHLF